MRATVMRDGVLSVEDIPDPTPGPGNMLVETIACGICGSDLHALKNRDSLREFADGMGIPSDMNGDVVMGHEFSARVVELGQGASGFVVGDVVVSIPLAMGPMGMASVGYSTAYPGGYGERMELTPAFCAKVPNGVDPRFAALTEPMAVGLHAVNRGALQKHEGALVIGCGPIGLAIIASLRLQGVDTIVAADFSPRRRSLAERMGAHVVVDPREEPAFDAWTRSASGKTPVMFEAVGVPGILDQIMRFSPRNTRIIVAGVCMQADTIWPIVGVTKELDVRFVLGYDPMEFRQTLEHIAGGAIDVAPLITGEVGIAGVAQAFEDLGDPEQHAKILVMPSLG